MMRFEPPRNRLAYSPEELEEARRRAGAPPPPPPPIQQPVGTAFDTSHYQYREDPERYEDFIRADVAARYGDTYSQKALEHALGDTSYENTYAARNYRDRSQLVEGLGVRGEYSAMGRAPHVQEEIQARFGGRAGDVAGRPNALYALDSSLMHELGHRNQYQNPVQPTQQQINRLFNIAREYGVDIGGSFNPFSYEAEYGYQRELLPYMLDGRLEDWQNTYGDRPLTSSQVSRIRNERAEIRRRLAEVVDDIYRTSAVGEPYRRAPEPPREGYYQRSARQAGISRQQNRQPIEPAPSPGPSGLTPIPSREERTRSRYNSRRNTRRSRPTRNPQR